MDELVSTKERFGKYVEMEDDIVKRLKRLLDPFGEVTRIREAPDRKTYDRLLLFSGTTKLEIQFCDGEAFGKYGDIRLDYISAFKYNEILRHPIKKSWRRIEPHNIEAFMGSIEILRWGKIKVSEADTLSIYIGAPECRFYLVSMRELQKAETVDYLLQEYGININHKKRENWDSAFIPVDYSDPVLRDIGTEIEEWYRK